MTKETVVNMTKKELESILSEHFGAGTLHLIRVPTDPREQAEPEVQFRFVSRYEFEKGET